MWRFGLDTVALGIVLVTLVTLMFAVLMMQRQRSQKTIAVWFAAGFVGIMLGSALTLGGLRLTGYRPVRSDIGPGMIADGLAALDVPGSSADAGGSGGGMGDGMAGGMRGGPNPKRDLTTLVRKIDLLTGDIGLKLSQEQGQSVSAALDGVENAEEMSDDDAKTKHDEILALLDEAQKTRLDAIGLPRPPRGAGGGGPPSAAPANPFRDERNEEAVKNLRQRFVATAR